MKKYITPKNLCAVYAIILLGVLIYKNYTTYSIFYDTYKNKVDILLQIMVFLAAACAAFANIKMMKSNNIMASVASEEIETLKRQHDYSIAPILQFIGYAQRVSCVNIKNSTQNLAIKVTIFAKLLGKEYTSSSYLLEEKGNIETELFLIPNIKEKFAYQYDKEKSTFHGFENILNIFLEDDNWFFIVYIDVEGKIHGTSLKCTPEEIPLYHHEEKLYSSLSEEEIRVRKTIYHPREQLFYILSDE